MRTTRRSASVERILSSQEFERMLQQAANFQKRQKIPGPQLLDKQRLAHKRAPAA